MEDIFENLPVLLIFTLLFLVLYVVLLNVYFIRKNGFHISVNCWFCNQNSKVLYANRNSFECPFCQQYNGFNENGDYNKIIEAQKNVSMNKANIFTQKAEIIPNQSNNGLCDSCIRNQQLKVIQLANYEPINNKNYDTEIKHFEKQLEKTYKLCKSCSKIVKSTIRKQNSWLFGNRLKTYKNSKQNQHKDKSNFKSNKLSQGFLKFISFLSILRIILLVLSVFVFMVVCGFNSYIPKAYLPLKIPPSNVIFPDFYTTFYNFTHTNLKSYRIVKYLPKSINIKAPNIFYFSLIGIIFEAFVSFMETNQGIFGKLNKFFSWIIIALISSVHFQEDIYIFKNTLQIFCSLWLIYNYAASFSNGRKPVKFSLKRIEKESDNEEYSENDSSTESLNDSKTTYRSALNKNSPSTANNSLNRSFQSTKSNFYTAKNIELNKNFNDLNLGVFDRTRRMSFQSVERPLSPNPFSPHNRPQSPLNNSFNYGLHMNNSSILGSERQNVSQSSLFRIQSPIANSFSENRASGLNQSYNSTSPRLVGSQSQMYKSFEPTFQATSNYAASTFNLSSNGQNHQNASFVPQARSQTEFYPRDTSSVLPDINSHTYSLRSQSRHTFPANVQNSIDNTLNNSFRPLSPATSYGARKKLLSPPKMNYIKSFHSSGENDNIPLSFFNQSSPNLGMYSNLNDTHQRMVVNTVSDVNCSLPFNSFISSNQEKRTSNSRSSSSTSGFISNGGLGKANSLPNSRENSPDRNSLLSEPGYHFKID